MWESNEETSFLFRSENAFARGMPRRSRSNLVDATRGTVTVLTPISSRITRFPSIPIEQHAFGYFVENFTFWPNYMPDIGHDYLTYALPYWHRAGPDSSLRLALSAFSLAVFGRARRLDKALRDADRFYVRSIIKTQAEIKELSSESIDHLLVSTMLMTNYEVCPTMAPPWQGVMLC
jgi:hypothetical protein